MNSSQAERQHQAVIDIFRAGVAAVEPEKALQRVLACRGDNLQFGERRPKKISFADFRNLFVVGFGKAGYPMAAAAEKILGDRIRDGVVIVKHGHRADASFKHIRIFEAGHPEPDAAGCRAAEHLMRLLDRAGERDLILVLVSGGGSALLSAPVAEIALADLQNLNRYLLGCGAAIDEINAVRKHVSTVKGGLAARRAWPARVVEFTLSDVVGDDPGTIASGPFAPDPTSFADARDVLEHYDLWDEVPASVRRVLQAGCGGDRDETPKPGEEIFKRVTRIFCGSNRMAQEAAAAKAHALGYTVCFLPEPLVGDVQDAAHRLWRFACRKRNDCSGPLCVIAGGETTVVLGANPGKGGRNQELATWLALELAGRRDVVALSAGTDGNDGPTDAAGAVVDGETVAVMRAAGMDAQAYCRDHNVYPLLDAVGALIRTGPTNTNVMDLQVVLFQ